MANLIEQLEKSFYGFPRTKLIKETEDALLNRIAPPFIASMNSPQDWDGVRKEYNKNKRFHVFIGGSTDTIFSDTIYKCAWRAWHDSIHIKYNLDFTIKSELEVATLHFTEGIKQGLDEYDCFLMYVDLTSHVKYHNKYNEHPIKQSDLISDCLKLGINNIVEKNILNKTYH